MKRAFAVVFCLSVVNVAAAAATIEVIGNLNTNMPLADDGTTGIGTRLFVDGQSTPIICAVKNRDPHRFRCTATLTAAPHFVRVEVHSPWHRLFSKNFAEDKRGALPRPLDLGHVALVKWDLPEITSVIEQNHPTYGHVFALTVHNPTQTSVNIERISVSTDLPASEACLVSAPFLFAVNDDVVLRVGAASRNGSAKVVDLDKTATTIPVTGTLATLPCRKEASMTLSFPVSFTVPKTDYIETRVALPRSVKVKPAPETPAYAKRSDIPVMGFRQIVFRLAVSGSDGPDIIGTYDVPAGRLVKIY